MVLVVLPPLAVSLDMRAFNSSFTSAISFIAVRASQNFFAAAWWSAVAAAAAAAAYYQIVWGPVLHEGGGDFDVFFVCGDDDCRCRCSGGRIVVISDIPFPLQLLLLLLFIQ